MVCTYLNSSIIKAVKSTMGAWIFSLTLLKGVFILPNSRNSRLQDGPNPFQMVKSIIP